MAAQLGSWVSVSMHDLCQTQTVTLPWTRLLWGSEIEKHRGTTSLRQVEKFIISHPENQSRWIQDTIPKTNGLPLKNMVSQKEILFQPSIFRGKPFSFQGGYVFISNTSRLESFTT